MNTPNSSRGGLLPLHTATCNTHAPCICRYPPLPQNIGVDADLQHRQSQASNDEVGSCFARVNMWKRPFVSVRCVNMLDRDTIESEDCMHVASCRRTYHTIHKAVNAHHRSCARFMTFFRGVAVRSGMRVRCSEGYLRHTLSALEWALVPTHKMRNVTAKLVRMNDLSLARLQVCQMIGSRV